MHRNIFRLLPYLFFVALISAGANWLIGGNTALIAGSVQFISLVLWLFVIQIYFMFQPIGATGKAWVFARLPFPLRIVLFLFGAAVSGHAIIFTLVNLVGELSQGG